MLQSRRRVCFAAPLVMVVSCGQPPPAATAPSEPLAAVAEPVDAMAADAAPAPAPVDVPLPTSPREGYVVLRFPEHMMQPPGFVSCHDFGPHYRGCNPPPPERVPAEQRVVPILDIGRSAAGHVIVVDAGRPGTIGVDSTIVVRAPLHDGVAPPARLRDARSRQVRIELALGRDEIMAGLELEVTAGGGPAWHPQPPPPLEATVFNVQWNGDASVVFFDLGKDHGVDHGSLGTVIDGKGRPVRGGRFTVVKAMARRSVAKVRLPAAEVERAGNVRIDPEP